jgi:cell division septum initiation protein DivIVA
MRVLTMAEKNFRNWVGFREETDREPIANPVDRIRDLESQLADLRSRRDITGLSREEFEILATETAMAMIKSAQAREAKALATADRVISESSRTAKDFLEGAENKARSVLAGAETRGRKYISVAELEAAELIREASREADLVMESKRREAAALATAARREAERVIGEASENVNEYRAWLADIITETERLYRSQTQALSAAESAIAQSRDRLDSAFARLSKMSDVVNNAINEDGTIKRSAPIAVESKRTRAAISAPTRSKKSAAKAPVKKSATKRK